MLKYLPTKMIKFSESVEPCNAPMTLKTSVKLNAVAPNKPAIIIK